MHKDNVLTRIEEKIRAIDAVISRQLDLIFHHEEFQQLERSWRGLHFLVRHAGNRDQVRIRFMSVSKRDLIRTLRRYKGSTWSESDIHRKLVGDAYCQRLETPFGCLIGDYYFQSTIECVYLEELGKICRAGLFPFVTGVSPEFLGAESYEALLADGKVAHRPVQLSKAAYVAPWRSLRSSTESKLLYLCMPRFLSRVPHRSDDTEINYVEGIGDTRSLCWSNAAYLMGLRICRSFDEYGWGSGIRGFESGGQVVEMSEITQHLRTHPDWSGSSLEVDIDDRQEMELSRRGFLALATVGSKQIPTAFSSSSAHDPAKYNDNHMTSTAKLASNLAYIFPVLQFAQHVRCIVRDTSGSESCTIDGLERRLNDWLQRYVCQTNYARSLESLTRQPLNSASVRLREVDGTQGHFIATLCLSAGLFLKSPALSIDTLVSTNAADNPPWSAVIGKRTEVAFLGDPTGKHKTAYTAEE